VSPDQLPTKTDLLAEIGRSYPALEALIAGLSKDQFVNIKDSQGWSVKDHVAHLAAWERSVVVFLQGRPRHEGLGVDQALFDGDDFDALNDVIARNHRGLSTNETIQLWKNTHQELMGLLDGLSNERLQGPSSFFVANGDERPLIGMIHSNTAEHFDEHRKWIEALIPPGE